MRGNWALVMQGLRGHRGPNVVTKRECIGNHHFEGEGKILLKVAIDIIFIKALNASAS